MKRSIYWVTYDGVIPAHAVRGGTRANGAPIYLGRAFYRGDILPAKVIPELNTAFIAWNTKEHSTRNFEILCQTDYIAYWHHAENGTVPENATPVGKTVDNEVLYVGRVVHNGTVTPGKVHPSHKCCYIPFFGEELGFQEYEVLVLA